MCKLYYTREERLNKHVLLENKTSQTIHIYIYYIIIIILYDDARFQYN